MTKLVVRLLGGYRVELDGQAIYSFEMDKARALLAYLVVEAGRPHRRETLASLLWPDRPDTVARANLRQALSCVRRALGDQRSLDREPPLFLFVTPTDVQFNTASDYMLDVAELEAFAHPSTNSPACLRQLLPEALCADFLAGFAVPDSEAFQAWVLSKQEYYHRLAIEILDEQNATFEGVGNYEQAVAAARLQLQLEPWLEEAHRRCMRGLALAGRRDEALRQYELCRRALETELAVEPAANSQALCADIRAGRLVAAARPSRPVTPLGSAAPARPPAALARLVARAAELGQLGRHLDAALAGETGVAFVSGDAGSGKTALLEAFASLAKTEQPDLLVAGARCSPGGSLDPFAPLRKLAEMLFGDLANDAAWRLHDRDQVDRLQRATGFVLASLAEHGLGLIDALVPMSSIAHRAGLSAVDSVGPTGVLREDRPERGERPTWWAALADKPKRPAPVSQGVLFDQLICTLAAIARKHPLLLLFDDLHWVDDASAAFLLHIGRELNSSRVLILGAYRSATVALGRRDPRSGEITRHPLAAVINELRRAKGEIIVELDRADGRAFVEAYVDTEPNRLGARFRDALYAQTGGHALFTVESLRILQERGELLRDEAGRWVAHESLDWGALPARVEAAIAERIEHLPEEWRRILSCASVQGDDFSGEMVAELTGAAVGEVLTCLSGGLARQHHLVRPEEAQRLGSGQRSVYRFTHHLFQKYLYDQLDPVERAQWHSAVAASLDRQAAGDPAEREQLAARLAWHYEAGGLPLQAARALHDAGRQAMRLSAFREALNRFDHGLALLADAPPSPERTEVEGPLEVARLGPLRNLEWIASPGLEDTLTRATQAWAGNAQGHPMLMILWAQAEHLFATGQFEEALAAVERMRAAATQCGEGTFVGLAHFHFGLIHHYAGNPQESEGHLDRMLAWLTPERRTGLRAAVGTGLSANALAFSALNLWLLGYPEQALARSRQALADARAAGDAVGQAASTALAANLLFFLRIDETTMVELSEQCYRLSVEQGLGLWQPYAKVLLGRLMITRGEDVAGIERMESKGWRDSGMAVGVDCFAVILADSCLLAAGRRAPGDSTARKNLLAKGLAAIDSMLGPGRVPCGQGYEAEMRRLQGELLLARDGLAAGAAALECFERAMQLGREKGALAWELRAAMSLVRLRERQGAACAAELAEARCCLADVYARFTEGFVFPDLRDAAALIGDSG